MLRLFTKPQGGPGGGAPFVTGELALTREARVETIEDVQFILGEDTVDDFDVIDIRELIVSGILRRHRFQDLIVLFDSIVKLLSALAEGAIAGLNRVGVKVRLATPPPDTIIIIRINEEGWADFKLCPTSCFSIAENPPVMSCNPKSIEVGETGEVNERILGLLIRGEKV